PRVQRKTARVNIPKFGFDPPNEYRFAGRTVIYRLAIIFAISLLCEPTRLFSQVATAPPVPEWIQFSQANTNEPTVFRKSFDIQLPLLKAILLCASEGNMSIRINDQLAGEVAGQKNAVTLDVTKFI